MRLREKTAIVTGAGRGIGRAIALALGREGASVAVVDMDMASAEAVATELVSEGRVSLAVKADVRDRAQIEDAIEKTLHAFKKIDILINNAGIDAFGPSGEFPIESWKRVIDVNLTGQFLFSQAAGRHMIDRKSGKIVFIASATAHRASPEIAAYSAAKAGVVQLAKVLAVEWARHNINVNSVSPGLTNTELVERFAREPSANFSARIKGIPLRRLNGPEDVANAVLFLASSDSDNITGQDIIVDGGMCAYSPASAVAAALSDVPAK